MNLGSLAMLRTLLQKNETMKTMMAAPVDPANSRLGGTGRFVSPTVETLLEPPSGGRGEGEGEGGGGRGGIYALADPCRRGQQVQ